MTQQWARLLAKVSAALVVSSTAASAEPNANDKNCIVRAAEFLPRVPGIAIKASRTSPLPAEIEAQLDKTMFHAAVEIDATAAGQDSTYRFICVVGPGVAPIIQRMQ